MKTRKLKIKTIEQICHTNLQGLLVIDFFTGQMPIQHCLNIERSYLVPIQHCLNIEGSYLVP